MSILIKFLEELLKPKQPVPNQPPPPQPKRVHIVCYSDNQGQITPKSGYIVLDDESRHEARVDGVQLQFTFEPSVQYGWGAWLYVEGEDIEKGPYRIVLNPDINVIVEDTVLYMPEIEIRGKFFYSQGQPVNIVEATGFRAYEKFLRGEDITPYLTELNQFGYNTIRVWLLNTSVGSIIPGEWPEFYGRLPEFATLCAQYGLWVEFTLFTQAKTLMPSAGAQVDHMTHVMQALRDVPCFLELVNEDDQWDNEVRPETADAFRKSGGEKFIISRGSNGADSAPPAPHRDYVLYHSNNLSEWQRKVGHNAMEWADVTGRPAMSNENTRPDNDRTVYHYYDAARAAALLCAGTCFHCNSYKHAQPADVIDRESSIQWALGANSVPLRFREGAYIHEFSEENSEVLRAYSRMLPSGEKYLVKIRY